MPTVILEIDLTEEEVEAGLAGMSVADFQKDLYEVLTNPNDVGEPYPHGPKGVRVRVER
jgi:hypothetical protein